MKNPECIWDAKAEHGEGARYDPATNCVWWVDILGQKMTMVEMLSMGNYNEANSVEGRYHKMAPLANAARPV